MAKPKSEVTVLKKRIKKLESLHEINQKYHDRVRDERDDFAAGINEFKQTIDQLSNDLKDSKEQAEFCRKQINHYLALVNILTRGS
jgi:chromosome segregation ATPase